MPRFDEDRSDAGELVLDGLDRVGAEQVEGGGKGVGLGGGWRQDGYAQGAVGRLAGAGVKNMAVGTPVGHEFLISHARGSQALVAEAERAEASRWVGGVGERDFPGPAERPGWRSDGQHAGTPAVEQGWRRPPVVADDLCGAIQGVAFSEASQVQDNSRADECDGLAVGVEADKWLSGSVAGVFEFRGAGDSSRAAGEAPGGREGAGGDVVGPRGSVVENAGGFQECEQIGLDGDRPEVGRGVEAADFGVVPVDTEAGFEGADEVERSVGQRQGARGVGWEEDFEVRAHAVAAGPEEVGAGGLGCGLGRPTRSEEVATGDLGLGRTHEDRPLGGPGSRPPETSQGGCRGPGPISIVPSPAPVGKGPRPG